MTYYTAKDLANSLRTVRSNTIRIAEDIPEDKYDFRPAPDGRSVRELLTHIAWGHSFQKAVHQDERRTTLVGLDFPSLLKRAHEEEKRPRSKAEILELLRDNGHAWASFIDAQDEAFLAERVDMPPGAQPASKSRFEMLLSSKEHEMHHRAQLMLVERLIGIVPHLTRQMQERLAAR
ncbi:MAG: DinB family protein [Vicinamibacterales bacterium]